MSHALPATLHVMRKTSVYLSESETQQLAQLAEREGRAKADILRAALASYAAKSRGRREFALFDSGEGPGDSVADIDEAKLLEGFGE